MTRSWRPGTIAAALEFMYTGYRVTLLLLCTAFVSVGLVIAALGPALPELARQTDKSLAQLGTLFIALFGGGLLAQSLSGVLADRFGRRIVLVLCAAMFGASALVMSLSTRLPLLLVFASLVGLGYGGISLSVNVLSSELTPHRRASTVNLVNVFFGVGAILGPLLAGLAIEWWGTPIPALQAGAALALIVSPVAAFVDMPASAVHGSRGTRGTRATPASDVSHLSEVTTSSRKRRRRAVVSLRLELRRPRGALCRQRGVGRQLDAGLSRTHDASRRGAGRRDHVDVLGGVVRRPHCRGGRGSTIVGGSAADGELCGGCRWRRARARGPWDRVANGDRLDGARLRVRPALPHHDGRRHRGVSTGRGCGGEPDRRARVDRRDDSPSLHGFLIARVGTWTSAAVTAVIVVAMLLGWMAIRRRFGVRV